MAATSAERIVYASKSRKWNSTQNNKFPTEFPSEHAENLEWIRKTEEETARKRAEEELRALGESQNKGHKTKGQELRKKQKRSEGAAKWIIIGIVGALIAMRAWQRYKENTL